MIVVCRFLNGVRRFEPPCRLVGPVFAGFGRTVATFSTCGASQEKRNFCLSSVLPVCCRVPHEVKDTLRALVRIGYDGRVTKTFRGPQAAERHANETRVLRHLEERGCPFVPRLLESDAGALRLVTTSCGGRVERLDADRTREIFTELLAYGVRHDDAEARNITYNQRAGRFCVIDFEFATILAPGTLDPDAVPPDLPPINTHVHPLG